MDSLVFETLIPKPMMQHYISLLLKHRRLILSGPSGTGKTYLTNRLAEYLVERSGRDVTEGIVSTFNMHQQSCKVRVCSSQECPCWTGAAVPIDSQAAAPHVTPGLFVAGPAAVPLQPGQPDRPGDGHSRRTAGDPPGRPQRGGLHQ